MEDGAAAVGAGGDAPAAAATAVAAGAAAEGAEAEDVRAEFNRLKQQVIDDCRAFQEEQKIINKFSQIRNDILNALARQQHPGLL
mmetsp:Transcript_14605/g.36362  ORF Transcript_14605/g.36362 Transcript_14605/m.36362 type:complete len:85 (-) Transcript_14605:1328-1582(-)